jgi:branched-chain amino acid transport system ATP-binding protein
VRAQPGLAQTWQTVELFDDPTVAAKGGKDTTVDEELKLLDLVAAADSMPRELTQAERKRASIGRALVARPRLLCLDEPAVGSDVWQSRAFGARLPGIARW